MSDRDATPNAHQVVVELDEGIRSSDAKAYVDYIAGENSKGQLKNTFPCKM